MRTLYLLLIAAANLLTAKLNPLVLAGGVLIVPVGSVLAGAVFVLRDIVQLRHGKRKTYTTILWAALVSAVMSRALGDTAHVAAASVVAFFASEAVDTEIFSRVRASLAARVLLSGAVGGCLDSALFVVLGLSPLGANMLPWEAVPFAVLGQVLVKIAVQIPAAIYLLIRKRRNHGGNKPH
jgi:uncharacterized PurR-regulated membrane protein YhhQ (DUF165 family)